MATTDSNDQEDTDDYPCTAPDCERVFGTQDAKNCHFGKAHKSLSRFEVACDRCGEPFETTQSRVEQNDHHFCSRECSSNFRKTRVTTECDNCGAEVSRRPKRINDRNFCDEDCHMKFQRGENHPTTTLKPAPCNYCGEETPLPKWKRKRYPNHYCDEDCYAAHLRESGCMVGKNNPVWKNGEADYGVGWHESKKEAVRDRDARECQNCGMAEADHREAYQRKLSVHHIVPVRSFDDPVERNAMSNLVALCIACHRKWEAMAPLRPVVE